MNDTQITRFLNSLGFTKSEAEDGVRIPYIRSINSDSTQSIIYTRDLLTFDFDNEMIYIKQFNHESMNGLLRNFKYENTNTIYNSVLIDKNYPFRQVMINDKIYKINKSTNVITSLANVEGFSNGNELKLSKKISLDPKTEALMFASPTTILSDYSVDPLCPALFLNYTPISENITDTYLEFKHIIGFELRSALHGTV